MPDHPASPRRSAAPGLSSGAWLQTVAALIWVPQAALLAAVVGGIAAGDGVAAAVWPACGIMLLGVARAGLDALGARRLFRAARAMLAAMRRDAVASLAGRSPLDAYRTASGAAASAVCEQAEAVLPYLLRFRAARLRVAVVPPVLLLVVLTQSWLAAVILVIAAPLIPLFMALIGLRAKEASEAQMLEIGSMNGLLLDRLRGLPTIRAYDAVDATAHRLRAAAEALRMRSMAVLRIAFLSSAVLELFASLGVAMVAVYVGFHLLGTLGFGAWGGVMPLDAGLFVLLLAPAFFEPLRDLSAAWHDRSAGDAAQAALRDLAAPPEQAMPQALASVPSMASDAAPGVAVTGLVYRYPGASHPVFDGFALEIAPGERVALLGPSGAGKSSLLALLAGLALPEAGDIRIGADPLTPDTAAWLRARIAWLGQRPALFAGSLQANILLGRRDLDAEPVRRSLLPRLPMTRPVGEDGAGLSGGEALRLALARAIVAPGAALILADEPTAHLDAETAADVTQALFTAAQGRTLLVATHDPVLAGRMDRVVVLA